MKRSNYELSGKLPRLTPLSKIKHHSWRGVAVTSADTRPTPSSKMYVVEWQGESLPLSTIAKRLGVDHSTALRRYKAGQSLADVFDTSNRQHMMVTHDGVTDTLKGWSRRTGIKYATLYYRYHTLNRRPPSLFDALNKRS